MGTGDVQGFGDMEACRGHGGAGDTETLGQERVMGAVRV